MDSFKKAFFPPIYLFTQEEAHVHQGPCVEVREKLSGVGSLLPLFGFWGLNPGHWQGWCQMPLPAEPSHQPPNVVFTQCPRRRKKCGRQIEQVCGEVK